MRCDSFFERLEDRRLFAATASIRGFVFNDINTNGHRDSGESGIATVTVYLDTNNNKKLDASEKRTATDANGNELWKADVDAGSMTLVKDIDDRVDGFGRPSSSNCLASP